MLICIAPILETSPRRSGIARIVKGHRSFTCTPCVSSPNGMSHKVLGGSLRFKPQLVLIYRYQFLILTKTHIHHRDASCTSMEIFIVVFTMYDLDLIQNN